MTTFAERCALIRESEIGRFTRIETPFGKRLLCYADLTATGRHLKFVEQWMERAQPFYANSHTIVSTTGRVMTELREEARRVILKSVHAGPEDVALFTGSGATSAINKLVGLLGWRISEPLERQYELSKHIPPNERPVVLVGPYEHHSNELPWLESIARVVETGLDDQGAIDLNDLEQKLKSVPKDVTKLGAFSAASNVTGVLSDVHAIAKLLHQHGALACFDYAAAAPYIPIDMHPKDPMERLDAVYLSPHKFIGGPHASGVLIADRSFFCSRTPERPGGGTVDFVCGVEKTAVDYTPRLDEREEGGTPALGGDFRAGLAFLVKEMLGPKEILEHETTYAKLAIERLCKHPNIKVLGPRDLPRLGIISFLIKDLHHDFAAVLLDHLFGIQNRAGCSCAGPYGLKLLGLSSEHALRIRQQVNRGLLGLKRGWIRLSLPYYATFDDIDFMLRAVEFVAEHGELFLPSYEFCWVTGVWRFKEREFPVSHPLSFNLESLLPGSFTARTESDKALSDEELRSERAKYFEDASALVADLKARWKSAPPVMNPPTGLSEIDDDSWFKFVCCDDSYRHAKASATKIAEGWSCQAYPARKPS